MKVVTCGRPGQTWLSINVGICWYLNRLTLLFINCAMKMFCTVSKLRAVRKTEPEWTLKVKSLALQCISSFFLLLLFLLYLPCFTWGVGLGQNLIYFSDSMNPNKRREPEMLYAKTVLRVPQDEKMSSIILYLFKNENKDCVNRTKCSLCNSCSDLLG